jgi:hypothetical protein
MFPNAGIIEIIFPQILAKWEKQNRDQSSTWRELKTIANNIQFLKNDLSGKFVKIYTDNQNVVSIVNKGSMKSELQDIALHIFPIIN